MEEETVLGKADAGNEYPARNLCLTQRVPILLRLSRTVSLHLRWLGLRLPVPRRMRIGIGLLCKQFVTTVLSVLSRVGEARPPDVTGNRRDGLDL